MWHRQQEPKPSSPSQEPTLPAATTAAPLRPEAWAPRQARPDSSRIGPGLRIKGEIKGREDFVIDGQFEGNILMAEAAITVGSTGRVTAEVEAREIAVHGRVHGNLKGRERVRIGSTGLVAGDIATPRLAVEEGAKVRGRIEMPAAEESRSRSVAASSTTLVPESLLMHGKEPGH